MPFRLSRSNGEGGEGRRQPHVVNIVKGPPLATCPSFCWCITAVFLFTFIALLACTSCWESTTTSTTLHTHIPGGEDVRNPSPSPHAPVSPPPPSPPSGGSTNSGGGNVITISTHAEATATNSIETSVTVTGQTTTHTVATGMVLPLPIESESSSASSSAIAIVNSSELAACDAIRLHNSCCDAALSKPPSVLPKPHGCDALYAPYLQSSQYGSGSRSSSASASGSNYNNYHYHSGDAFIPCNSDKQVTMMCCKACMPSCMACSWGVPVNVYHLCYRRKPMGCHEKCRLNRVHSGSASGSSGSGHGLCPVAKH